MSRPEVQWDPTLGDPVQPASRVLTLNASRISDFQRCRRMFFLRWVLRLSGDDALDTDAAWIGSTTHEVLHALHGKGHATVHGDAEIHAGEARTTDPRVEAMVRTHALLCPGERAEYLGGELDARWLIARKSVLLTGRFDALWRYRDGTVEVRDYKTGRCPDSLDDDPGAAIYLLLAANLDAARTPTGQLRPLRVVYESLSAPDGRLVSLTATTEMFRAAFNEVVSLADHIRREKSFPANPSVAMCRTCAYRRSCPVSEARSDDS